jgi:uridine kinase
MLFIPLEVFLGMIVLIGGPSGSGKTTLAEKLAKEIPNSLLVKMDNFFLTHDERKEKGIENWDDPMALDWDRFNAAVERLSKLEEIEVPVYNKADGTRTTERQKGAENIILEGLWALSQRVKFPSDLRVFLDEEAEVRLRRRMKRDKELGRKREFIIFNWDNQVLPAEDVHVFPTRASADIVIDQCNGECFREVLEKVKEKIASSG